jgi:Plasmid pRiA4b ORF-3-like protein
MPFGPTVHTLKLSLRDVRPLVWRRVVVASETPLPKVAHLFVAVMGWEGYHLHQFDVGGVLFGPADDDADYQLDERSAVLKHLLPSVKSKLRWDYDFGDGWEHDVVVEAIETPRSDARYPVCLDGRRACPPEDCGGPGGYARLLAALKNPDDPERDEYVQWLRKGFIPAAFDVVAANRRLRQR